MHPVNPTGFSVQTQPTNGTLVFNSDGTYTYTPNSNYSGSDSFIYEVCDLGMPIYCDTAIVKITITPVNDPPVITPVTVIILIASVTLR